MWFSCGLIKNQVKTGSKTNHGEALSNTCLVSSWAKIYPALDIFKLGKNLKTEAVGLSSSSTASIHIVSQSKNQSHHLSHAVFLQQKLKNKKDVCTFITLHFSQDHFCQIYMVILSMQLVLVGWICSRHNSVHLSNQIRLIVSYCKCQRHEAD